MELVEFYGNIPKGDRDAPKPRSWLIKASYLGHCGSSQVGQVSTCGIMDEIFSSVWPHSKYAPSHRPARVASD